MKKRLATFIAAIILCAVLAITAGLVNLSATETKAETYRDPFAEYDKAIPLNLSCEDHGIRVTAVSALLTDLELKIRYDLQDLEGGRLDYNYINRNADDWFRYNMELSDPDVTGISTGMSSKGDSDSFTLYQSVLYKKINSEDTLSVRIPRIPATRNVSIPLLPLLEEYGQATEAASLPAPKHAAHVRPSDWPDIKKVLDYSHPLDIPLNDGQDQKKVLLTGIGWIDGQLHIQIHDPDNALMLGRSLSSSDYSDPVRLRYDSNNYPDTYPETGRIVWDDNNDDNRDWVEIIIGCRPEDLEKLNYSLNMTYLQEMLEGNWEFNIPLEEIRDRENTGKIPYAQLFGFRQELIPVNYSCEDQGIRMTAVAALIRDNSLWIVYNLQDLEGDRIEPDAFKNAQYDWFTYNLRDTDYSWIQTGRFSYGDMKDQYLVMQRLEFDRAGGGNNLTVSLHGIPAKRNTAIRISPFLEKYGKANEGRLFQDLTGTRVSFGIFDREQTKVLECTDPLNVPLSEDPDMKDFLLDGIGWIEGRLNMRIRYPDGAEVELLYGNSESEIRYGGVKWDADGRRGMDSAEFMIECKPEEFEQQDWYLDVQYAHKAVEGNWELSIPLEEIRP